jgi:GNAT superfamily N-acetyltransferase
MSSKDLGYYVRLYEPGDEEEIIELLKTSFPEWKEIRSPIEYWKWKYIENPLGSIIVVADWNGKIVGVVHRLNLNIKTDEKTFSNYGDDVTVHSDYRKKGIYKNMIKYTEELSKEKKITLNFGISISDYTVSMAEREGYVFFPFTISHMIQIRDVRMHFKKRPVENNLLAIFGFSVLKLLNRIKRSLKQTEIQSEFRIENILRFDERINGFWEKIQENYQFIIEKKQEYLNWRYCDPRSSNKGRYFIKQAEKQEKILGFIVLETKEKDDYIEGYVVDLLAHSGRIDVARKLLEEACLFFQKLNINVVHYRVVQNHTYQALFRELGFIEVPSKFLMSYKMFQEKEKIKILNESSPSQIYFNYGDYF